MNDVQSTIHAVKGFKVAGVHAGLKADGALDMTLIYSETPCVAAGIFTTNLVKAAPVLVDQETLAKNNTHIRAVIINTKCANACTGQQGMDNARQMQRWVAERLGIGEDEVLVMSTGVIGTQLDMTKIRHGIDLVADALGDENWEAAARAIMTTDTRPKFASWRDRNTDYVVSGIAKGAGMIAPNMATMLGIVATDLSIQADAMPAQLKTTANLTFNCISVDGDMSTNDTLLLLANGQSGIRDGVDSGVVQGVLAVCHELATSIVRDGEGATKFITINVRNAHQNTARQIANTIATSPLVKTAFYGGDANWGRIIAAAGRAGVPFDADKAELWICSGENWSAAPYPTTNDWEDPTIATCNGAIQLFAAGIALNYDEGAASQIMRSPSITVTLDCGIMNGEYSNIWTCDFSHDYVSINGHYRS